MASAFGTTCGLDDSSTDISTWNSHPISVGMGTLDVLAAGALGLVSPATPVGVDGSRTVVAQATPSNGRVAIIGDINWATNSYFPNVQNSLFTDNTFAWLSSGGGGPQCGNGTLEGSEVCDDGNTVDCDGCSSVCTFETGCGDNVVCGEEECDDGNNADGDGCSGNCRNEGVGGSGGGTTSSGTGGATSSGTGGATSSGTSSGSSSDDESSVDGCGCRAVGPSSARRAGAFAVLALLALALRRRRRP